MPVAARQEADGVAPLAGQRGGAGRRGSATALPVAPRDRARRPAGRAAATRRHGPGRVLEAAEAAAQIGGLAAHHQRQRIAAMHGQVGARARGGRAPKASVSPGRATSGRCMGMSWPLSCAPRSAPASAETGGGVKAQRRSGQRDFEGGAVVFVAGQCIGQPVRALVHGAGGGNALVLVAVAAAILEAGQHAGLDHGQAHAPASRSRWNSSSAMGTKRTESPGCSSAAGSRAGSNMASGVAPMMFQPPGRRLG